MPGTKPRIVSAVMLACGVAGSAAAAAPPPVGSLCNAEGRIEVFSEAASTPCVAEPEKEMKALFKAQAEFQRMSRLSVEKKLQIDARIERRIREIRKLKAEAKKDG